MKNFYYAGDTEALPLSRAAISEHDRVPQWQDPSDKIFQLWRNKRPCEKQNQTACLPAGRDLLIEIK